MSLSTRRPPGSAGPFRPPLSASTARGREPAIGARDDLSSSSSDNRYRSTPHSHSQRSRSVPRQGSDNPYRSRRVEVASPMPSPVPSHSTRHSAQSSVSSTSTGSSIVSAASTAPSSLWDYVGWKGSNTSPVGEREEGVPSEPLESSVQPDATNAGTLWSRVAAVAGGLSVNVSKAWEAKDDLPEPDTPPGHDSRITTALKKHYIKQVSDPRQLPAWLFSDIERQVGRSHSRHEPLSFDGQDEEHNSPPAHERPAPVRSRTRRDDAYTTPQATTRRERMEAATYSDDASGPTRAATRLRAMRDARRGPTERRAYDPTPASEPEPEPEPEPQPVTVTPSRPRLGLPPRPGRPRRE